MNLINALILIIVVLGLLVGLSYAILRNVHRWELEGD